MKGNLKRPDFRELMNPLLRTTAGILFFSWFFYRSAFAIILFIFPGILYFRKCVREQREKKRWELTVQFKECLLAVANSLRTDPQRNDCKYHIGGTDRRSGRTQWM